MLAGAALQTVRGQGATMVEVSRGFRARLWEQLRVRMQTGEAGRLDGHGCERAVTQDVLVAIVTCC